MNFPHIVESFLTTKEPGFRKIAKKSNFKNPENLEKKVDFPARIQISRLGEYSTNKIKNPRYMQR